MSRRLHRVVPKSVSVSIKNSTKYLKIQPIGFIDKEKPPVILNHGNPGGIYSPYMFSFYRDFPLNAIIASGRTVYMPFTGSNWSTNNTYPITDGTGQVGIDDVLLAAEGDGFNTDLIDFHGTSMGGSNALNWAWRNEDRINSVYLVTPMTSIMSIYDNPLADMSGVSTSLRNVYDSENRTELEAAVLLTNPIQNAISIGTLSSRIRVLLAVSDELIDYEEANAFYGGVGISITTTPGGHNFGPTQTEFNEYDAPNWFDQHA